ncbi:hypothetical protein [uncultured Jatrophihabitans sp.]|uniref:hypothetical protein n=1 Tax=uncultured Jatrophihabitans sp. TaxID=1610747 RepID=UPI0035CCA6AE
MTEDRDASEQSAREELGEAIIEIAHLEHRINGLELALGSCSDTGLAIGILMDRYGLSEEEAAIVLAARGKRAP